MHLVLLMPVCLLYLVSLTFLWSPQTSPAGWGKVKHPGGTFPRLQQAQFPLVSNHACYKQIDGIWVGFIRINKQMVCAGDIRPGSGKIGCHGDSGGPLVCRDPNGKYSLQGVASFASGTCNFEEKKKKYTVFARVSEFREWIDEQMKEWCRTYHGVVMHLCIRPCCFSYTKYTRLCKPKMAWWVSVSQITYTRIWFCHSGWQKRPNNTVKCASPRHWRLKQ